MLVIGMAGRAGSGKDTVVGMVREHLEGLGMVVHDLAFADPLKRMYQSFFEGDPYTEDRYIKEQWPVPRTGGRTMRYILQALGTGFGRDLIDPNIWNWDLVHKVSQICTEHLDHYPDDHNLVILIRDIRFPDEVDITHSLGSSISSRVFDIRRFEPKSLPWIKRWVRRALRRGPHVSETAHYRQHLQSGRDITVFNEASLSSLRLQVEHHTHAVVSDYFKNSNKDQPVADEQPIEMKNGTITISDDQGNVLTKTEVQPTTTVGHSAWYAKDIPDLKPALGFSHPVMDKQVRLSEETMATLESRGFSRQMIVEAALGLLRLEQICHVLAVQGGWWTNLETNEPLERNVGDLMSLINTEAGEAYDAHRTGCNDSHLTSRKGFDTEIGDMIIRTMDMCGGLNLETVEAIFEKLAYNVTRADHKIENRRKDGGKKL